MDCYVYLHRKKSNGEIFYIGKGRNKRAWKKTQRSDWWKRIEAKHGRTVEIVCRNLTDEQAFELEKDLIDWIGLENLCNLREGGDGGYALSNELKQLLSKANKGKFVSAETREKIRKASTGRKHTEETKRKLREARLKQVMPIMSEANRAKIAERMRNRVVSDETRRKISESKKGVKTGIPMPAHLKEKLRAIHTGRRISDEQKRQISLRNTGRKHTEHALIKIKASNIRLNEQRRKPVKCSNGMIFTHAKAAELWIRENIAPKASFCNIVSCCNGRLKTAYGFTWSHV